MNANDLDIHYQNIQRNSLFKVYRSRIWLDVTANNSYSNLNDIKVLISKKLN